MAYKFSRGKRGIGDIEFEDDADTGIDFEPDTIKLETGGQERVVVNNTEASFSVPIRATSIEYTDGDNAITQLESYKLNYNGLNQIGRLKTNVQTPLYINRRHLTAFDSVVPYPLHEIFYAGIPNPFSPFSRSLVDPIPILMPLSSIHK